MAIRKTASLASTPAASQQWIELCPSLLREEWVRKSSLLDTFFSAEVFQKTRKCFQRKDFSFLSKRNAKGSAENGSRRRLHHCLHVCTVVGCWAWVEYLGPRDHTILPTCCWKSELNAGNKAVYFIGFRVHGVIQLRPSHATCANAWHVMMTKHSEAPPKCMQKNNNNINSSITCRFLEVLKVFLRYTMKSLKGCESLENTVVLGPDCCLINAWKAF